MASAQSAAQPPAALTQERIVTPNLDLRLLGDGRNIIVATGNGTNFDHGGAGTTSGGWGVQPRRFLTAHPSTSVVPAQCRDEERFAHEREPAVDDVVLRRIAVV